MRAYQDDAIFALQAHHRPAQLSWAVSVCLTGCNLSCASTLDAPCTVHGFLGVVSLEDAPIGREGGHGEIILQQQTSLSLVRHLDAVLETARCGRCSHPGPNA